MVHVCVYMCVHTQITSLLRQAGLSPMQRSRAMRLGANALRQLEVLTSSGNAHTHTHTHIHTHTHRHRHTHTGTHGLLFGGVGLCGICAVESGTMEASVLGTEFTQACQAPKPPA